MRVRSSRLELALDDDVKLLALTLDERAVMLAALEDRRRSSPNCGPSYSTIISGGAAKVSTDVSTHPYRGDRRC
jgi:hypothetical protein